MSLPTLGTRADLEPQRGGKAVAVQPIVMFSTGRYDVYDSE